MKARLVMPFAAAATAFLHGSAEAREPKPFAVAEVAVHIQVEPYIAVGFERAEVPVVLEPGLDRVRVPVAGWMDTNVRDGLVVELRPPPGAPGLWRARISRDLDIDESTPMPLRRPDLVIIEVLDYEVERPLPFTVVLESDASRRDKAGRLVVSIVGHAPAE